ncbi:universal stress protein [Streptomyces wedmorensis]|uniref:universal stress protein n=1 Tax=Streptomyces wedmorensis TaxID=43759 RepID=UPI0037B94028
MEGTPARPGPGRVVGVDGSPSARTAVVWAASEAALRGSTLFLVHAADTGTRVPSLPQAEIAGSRQAGREPLDRTVEAGVDLAAVRDEAHVPGFPAAALAAPANPPVFSWHSGDTLCHAERGLLSETTAGWAEKYPDVRLTHEVLVGSPVETPAGAAEHVPAVVGRTGGGGHTGMRVGSVVHGLLHRARCPVITVPVR